MKTIKTTIIFFACAFLASSTSMLFSHNDPSIYDMDSRFRFKLTEEEVEQEKSEEESADQKKKDKKEKEEAKSEEAAAEHKKQEQIKLALIHQARKSGPSEGH